MKKTSPAYWQRLRSHRLLWNLFLLACIILGMAIVAHLAMQIGTRHGARRTVPDFTGIPIDEARRLAAGRDLDLHINDSLFVPAYQGGIVLDQLPEGGVEVKPGRTIYVTINSVRQKMAPVPYVAGRSLRQAKNMLEIAGFEIARLVYRDDMATNYVLEEQFDGRPVTASEPLEAEIGSGITLVVGVEGGYGTAIVPQAVGLSLKEAKSRLWEQGLNIGRILFDDGINLLNQKEARVYLQTPSAERSAAYGATVDLRLTLDTEKLDTHRAAAEKQAREVAEERLEAEQARADSLALEALEGAAGTTAGTGPESGAGTEEGTSGQTGRTDDEFFF